MTVCYIMSLVIQLGVGVSGLAVEISIYYIFYILNLDFHLA